MRGFDYSTTPPELLTEDIMRSTDILSEHKGRQQLYIEQRPDELEALCEIARIQSTGASNAIEGIRTTDKRLRELMEEKVAPRNRDEEEIAGYRDVLALIHESYDAIAITPNNILQLHRNLYRPTSLSFGGRWKDSDNVIMEVSATGESRVRFRPTPAIAVPDAMDRLCSTYNEAIAAGRINPLILAAMFTFDFTCIHPFNDGNGRMSRLLTLLMLYRSGYRVGKYVSIEHEIERTKETYYEALQASSAGWSEGENSYAPFVRYLLGCMIGACRAFEERVEGIVLTKMSKPERVEGVFERTLGTVSKADIQAECPDISEVTIARTLSALLKAGKIEKVGGGRSTRYVWVGEHPQEVPAEPPHVSVDGFDFENIAFVEYSSGSRGRLV